MMVLRSCDQNNYDRGQSMIRKTLLSLAVSLPMAVGLGSGSHAQDYSAEPSYGSVSLSSGFSPDPYRVDLQSGGSINVGSRLGGDCRGYIANAPDFRLNYDAGSVFSLTFSVDAGADTTLVINDPNANFVCDDDSGEGLNPSITFDSPVSGQYDVWVGTFGDADYEDATLFISELGDQSGGSGSSSNGSGGPDWSLEPTYGSVSLNSGFTPDPYRVDLASGGSHNASELNSSCNGFIATAPDFRLNYTAGSLPLIISVDSSADTTLVINNPNGGWSCNDDGGEGLNPSITFDPAMSGQYDIYVGTFGGSDLQDAQLHISELYSN